MKKLLVTGSESFIGREFVRLANARNYHVTTVDTVTANRENHIVCDIRDVGLGAIMPPKTECVVHLAAISRDADCRKDSRAAFDVNVVGMQNVIDASVARNVRQIVFASSEWVYGEVENDGVQIESLPIDVGRIAGEYALSKIVGERLIAIAVGRGLTAGTILRFGIVYGPRYNNWSAVESIFAKTGVQEVVTIGSAATARRFIHVSDIAAGILASLDRSGLETFNLSGDDLITLREVFEVSAVVHGRRPRLYETEPSNVSVRNPDNRLAKELLGWQPGYDLRDGLLSLLGQLEPRTRMLTVR